MLRYRFSSWKFEHASSCKTAYLARVVETFTCGRTAAYNRRISATHIIFGQKSKRGCLKCSDDIWKPLRSPASTVRANFCEPIGALTYSHRAEIINVQSIRQNWVNSTFDMSKSVWAAMLKSSKVLVLRGLELVTLRGKYATTQCDSNFRVLSSKTPR